MGIVSRTSGRTLKIKLLNAHGNGFTDTVEVTEGTTMGQLFAESTQGANPDSYQITVNREATSRDYVLKDGDRVTITPSKITGA